MPRQSPERTLSLGRGPAPDTGWRRPRPPVAGPHAWRPHQPPASPPRPPCPASRRAVARTPAAMTASRMRATTGAATRSPWIRPSAVSRSHCAREERIANSNSGCRDAISSRTASSPRACRSSQGSMPFSATAMKVCATNLWSSSNARSAAFWPAASPSNVKTTWAPRRCVVAEQPPHDPDVVRAERRAAGRHRRPHAGEVAGHHVGVALDDDDLPCARDLAPGQVEAVQHLGLLVDRRLGGVEVLGLDRVVVEESAGAESDDVAGLVADRPEQPAAEPVVQPAPSLAGEPEASQLLLGERLAAQVAQRAPPAARGEADAECRGGVTVEAALGEELSGRHRVARPAAAARDRTARPPDAPRSGAAARPLRRGGRRRGRLRRPRSATPCRPGRPARSTASVKERWSSFWTNEMTSPPSPQPKQCHRPTGGRTCE